MTSTTAPLTTGGSTLGWVGSHEKDTETNFALAPTEMGVRVYVAKIATSVPQPSSAWYSYSFTPFCGRHLCSESTTPDSPTSIHNVEAGAVTLMQAVNAVMRVRIHLIRHSLIRPKPSPFTPTGV